MNRAFLLLMLATGLLSLSSCTTYYISMDSFRQQFAGIDSTKYKEVAIRGPIGEVHRYRANPITNIKCADKNGNPAELQNSPSVEIRFTYGENNNRTTFYFDRIFVSDSSVAGVESRFIQSIRKTVPLKSVTKIEVQDGKKNFHYL
jgi:hypothetical protein